MENLQKINWWGTVIRYPRVSHASRGDSPNFRICNIFHGTQPRVVHSKVERILGLFWEGGPRVQLAPTKTFKGKRLRRPNMGNKLTIFQSWISQKRLIPSDRAWNYKQKDYTNRSRNQRQRNNDHLLSEDRVRLTSNFILIAIELVVFRIADRKVGPPTMSLRK